MNKLLVWCFFVIFAFTISPTQASTFTLFDGSTDPSFQGWTTRAATSHQGGTIQTDVINSDIYISETTLGAFNHHGIDTGAGTFVVTMRAAVTGSSHNYADAGFFFSVVGFERPDLGVGYVEPNRLYSLYIDPTRIGFWDDLGGTYSLDTSIFHEYGIAYQNDVMKIFIDTSIDDIVNGLAAPVLERTIPPEDFFAYNGSDSSPAFQRHYEGVISFGDWTNDYGVNSLYSVDYIKVAQVAAREQREPYIRNVSSDPQSIPEPSSILLILAAGLGMVGAMKGRKS